MRSAGGISATLAHYAPAESRAVLATRLESTSACGARLRLWRAVDPPVGPLRLNCSSPTLAASNGCHQEEKKNKIIDSRARAERIVTCRTNRQKERPQQKHLPRSKIPVVFQDLPRICIGNRPVLGIIARLKQALPTSPTPCCDLSFKYSAIQRGEPLTFG